MSYYKRHVFFCLNQRIAGEDCCANRGAEAAFDQAKTAIKQAGLAGAGGVRVNRAGCLDRCSEGPVCVVYPEAVWYSWVDAEDVAEIVQCHLIGGEVVERLRLPDPQP